MTNIIVSWVENFVTQCCFLEIHDLVYHQRQQTDSDVHDQNYAEAILREISRIRDCPLCRRLCMQTNRGSIFSSTASCVNLGKIFQLSETLLPYLKNGENANYLVIAL